jgi:hypothetical protein
VADNRCIAFYFSSTSSATFSIVVRKSRMYETLQISNAGLPILWSEQPCAEAL